MVPKSALGTKDESSLNPAHPSVPHLFSRTLLQRFARALRCWIIPFRNGARSNSPRSAVYSSKSQLRCLAPDLGRAFDVCTCRHRHKSRSFLANVCCVSSTHRPNCIGITGDRARFTTTCVGCSQSSADMACDSTYTFRDSLPAPGTEDCARALGSILSPLASHLPPEAPYSLLREFGSISGVASASEAQLRKLLGQTNPLVDMLLVCRQLIEAAMHERIERSSLDPTDRKLRQYIAQQIGFQHQERLIAIFGNGRNEFITMETVALGGLDEVRVTSRLLFGRAMSLDARCFLLAHNHPSGCANPSNGDVLATREINKLAEALGIDLLDHLIVAKGQVVSMRERGLL